ncbi:MAG: hypothetical protein Q9174_003071 [Haloplaca sp. 1 TL-2023]
MYSFLLPSIIAFGLHVVAFPALDQRQTSLESYFLSNPLDITFLDDDGGKYSIVLDTTTMCTSTYISNPNPFENQIGLTLGKLLDDFDRVTTEAALDAAADALQEAFLAAKKEYYHYHCGAPPEFALAPTASTDPDSPSDLESPVDRGDWIKEGNRGAITATMVKGTGLLLATSLSVTSILLTDPETKLITSAVSASVSTVLLFLLGAITDWAKGQGSLNKSDAAIIKIFAEWSKSTLGAVADRNDDPACYSTGTSINTAQTFSVRENPLYQDFGMVTRRQALELEAERASCGI